MHFKGLDLNLLVALEALLDERSVTRAAERLNLSQPAISGALQRLRIYMKDDLLQRVGRRLEHTPKAAALYPTLRALLADVRTTLAEFPPFDPEKSRYSFRVAMSSFTAELLMPAISRILADRAPLISLEVDYATSQMFQHLNAGTKDCCISVNDRTLFDPDHANENLLSAALFSDPFVLVGSKAHLDHDEPSRPVSLRSRPLIVVRVGENIRSVVERALDAIKDGPRAAFIVPSYVLALEMVRGSNLIAVVRASLARQLESRDDLRIMPVPLDLPVLQDALIWHARAESDPAQRWFREIICEAAKERWVG